MTSATGTVRSRWILAAVSMALFCVQIDYFAMNLALPRMASELNSNATDLQWVISVYMLTSLVTLAGVGVAVSGTALEMLQRGGMSAGGAIDLILWVLAALLLPADVLVLLVARLRTAALSANPHGNSAE